MSSGIGFSGLSLDLLSWFVDQAEAVHLLRADHEGRVSVVNRAMAGLLGTDPELPVGVPTTELLTEGDASLVQRERQREPRQRPPGGLLLLNFVDADHFPQTLRCVLAVLEDGFVILGERAAPREDTLQRELLELNNTLAVLSRENARRSRELQVANRKLEETLDELNRSFWHLRKIQEVLPICVQCGKVKTSEASWEPVADYLRKHSLFLSHGFCPECAAVVMEEWGLNDEGTNR